MGNVMATAAGIVGRVVNTIKDTAREATRKAAEVVVDIHYRAKDKLADLATKALTEVVRFSINHSRIFKAVCWTTGGISVSLIMAPIAMAIVLPCVGFTSGGIAAGSLAAAWQAMIGNVAVGSLFSILTSAGMGGFGVTIVAGGLTVAGGVLGATTATLSDALGRGGGGRGPGSGPAAIGHGPRSSPEGASGSGSNGRSHGN